MRTRTFVLAVLLVALLLAGVGSYFASSHPDGLEYVADRTGFADSADQGREARSGGAAGVAGVLIVLVLAGGLGYALRRRTPAETTD